MALPPVARWFTRAASLTCLPVLPPRLPANRLPTPAAAAAAAVTLPAATPARRAHSHAAPTYRRAPGLDGVTLPGGDVLECLDIPATTPTAPPIVLLHEALGCVAWWKTLPHALAAATGARVFAYSRHGHGGSPPLRRRRDLRYLHDEALGVLPEVLAARGLATPLLVGHSDGATIALLHAAAPAPTPPAGVVAISPHEFVEPGVTDAGIRAAAAAYAAGGALYRAMHRDHVAADAIFAAWHDTWLDPAFAPWNVVADLATITCPIVAMQGDADEYATLAQVDTVVTAATASPRVTRIVLPHCSHSPFRTHTPDIIAAVVAAHRAATTAATTGS